MKALRITRHCVKCSRDFGCTNGDVSKLCYECESQPEYCGSDWQDETHEVCPECKGGAR